MKNCLHCKKDFPILQKINGRVRNLCSRRFCLECSPFGQNNRSNKLSASPATHKVCNICLKDLPLSDFLKTARQIRWACKKCDADRVKNIATNRRQNLIDRVGGACVICGYNRYAGSLDFHHVDSSAKDFQLSSLSKYSLDEIEKELPKCVLLCCRCHREVHAGVVALP